MRSPAIPKDSFALTKTNAPVASTTATPTPLVTTSQALLVALATVDTEEQASNVKTSTSALNNPTIVMQIRPAPTLMVLGSVHATLATPALVKNVMMSTNVSPLSRATIALLTPCAQTAKAALLANALLDTLAFLLWTLKMVTVQITTSVMSAKTTAMPMLHAQTLLAPSLVLVTVAMLVMALHVTMSMNATTAPTTAMPTLHAATPREALRAAATMVSQAMVSHARTSTNVPILP